MRLSGLSLRGLFIGITLSLPGLVWAQDMDVFNKTVQSYQSSSKTPREKLNEIREQQDRLKAAIKNDGARFYNERMGALAGLRSVLIQFRSDKPLDYDLRDGLYFQNASLMKKLNKEFNKEKRAEIESSAKRAKSKAASEKVSSAPQAKSGRKFMSATSAKGGAAGLLFKSINETRKTEKGDSNGLERMRSHQPRRTDPQYEHDGDALDLSK